MIEPEDLEALAAEYALGSLDGEERGRAEARRAADPAFDAAIRAWEERLAPLIETIGSVEPPPDLFGRIARRLAEPPIPVAAARRRWPRLWRIEAAIGALAACLALGLGLWSAFGPSQREFSGILAESSGAQGFRLVLDPGKRTLTAVPLRAPPLAEKSYELWLIARGAQPAAYGLLETRRPTSTAVRGSLKGAEAGAWAVTIEPKGGSPTGKATGPIIYQGRLSPT